MTSEQLQASGLNTSITHVDFMMGSKELNITGITHDGTEGLYSSMAIGPKPLQFRYLLDKHIR